MRSRIVFHVIGACALALTGCAGGQGSSAVAADESAARRTPFVCEGGGSFVVGFTAAGAVLDVAGRRSSLAALPVASGMHYAGEGQDLRGKGAELTWTDPAGVVRRCREAELAGTAWTLVHFQSSDDAIGTVIPPNVERYTMQFDPEGGVALQLDCNRASARWQATAPSATGGALSISPGAMTRAMCAPGALDAQLARDLARVRSYTWADGNLALALEADAGIYLWKPASPSGG